MTQAKFSQSRNDMYWKYSDAEDGFIRWVGYDDANWWDNVAPTAHARTRVGPDTGRIYTIDFTTGEITITPSPPSEREKNHG